MRVKKFEAKSMKEALKMVKFELGPDAVILGARDNRKSFGIGGETSVEVTAAVSESTLHKKRYAESRFNQADREKFNRANARTQKQIIEKVIDNRMVEQQPRVARPMTSTSYIDIQDDEAAPPSPRRSAALGQATGRAVNELLGEFEQEFNERPAPGTSSDSLQDHALNRIRSAAREAWKNNPFGQETSAPIAPSSAAPTKEIEIRRLQNEISRLQEALSGQNRAPAAVSTVHPGADYGLPYDLSFIFQKLTESGIGAEQAVGILKEAQKAIDPIQLKKRPIVDAWVARWILGHVRTVEKPWAGRLHLFVGGSGSGKTSSLIKMASHLVVKERKKIAILSADTKKVGSVEQMKIYSQILNVPFAVIRGKDDWEWALSQLRGVDHILVDYPGMQLRELEEMSYLKSLLPPENSMPTTHLCVSATMKDSDALDAAKRYRAASCNDLIFTNLDQSVQHGVIYNVHQTTGLPLHSFGIGGRVPEDFETASAERVLDLIFKLTKVKRDNP